MRKLFVLFLLFSFALCGCSPKKEAFKLQQGTPVYQLAKALAAVLPSLDPDTNKILVSTREFTITAGEVIQSFHDSLGQRTAQLKDLDAQRLKDVIGQRAVRLAERKLMLREAAKAKRTVTPEELSSALNSQYQQSGGEQQFMEILKTNGIDIEYAKNLIKDDLFIQKYLEGVLSSETKVTEGEIQKAYQEDKTASVQHILLLTQGKTDAQKAEIRKKMEEILTRAKNSEDFAELAKKYSEDPGSKDKDGLYTDFGRGRMVKPFEDAAFSVPVSEISGIVETAYGYHILKVVDRKKETQPLDAVRPHLEAQIKQQKQFDVFQAFMTKLKEKTKFEAAEL